MLASAVFMPLAVFWTGADWASVARRPPGVGGYGPIFQEIR